MINSVKNNFEKAFTIEFKDLLVDVNITREAVGGVYDPVLETYTGGNNPINLVVKGVYRKPRTKIVDGINITNDDIRLTIPQSWLSIEPTINDTVDADWRVIKIEQDVAKTFWDLYLRKV